MDHGECWAAGFAIGKKAKVRENLPHPTHYGPTPEHNQTFWEGMCAALHLRDLDVSMFLVVIPQHTLYIHDCDECTYLGRHLGEDLYVHVRPERSGWAEAIHRYGDDGPEYGCMLLPHPSPVYQEIERRMKERGITFTPLPD